MLTVYWVCFAIGGVFVLLAVVGGLDGSDFELDADGDLDFDFAGELEPDDVEVTDPGDRPRQPFVWSRARRLPWWAWLSIVKSLKFWTFGLAFFGLTGLVLSSMPLGLPAGLVQGLAIAIGLVCGALVSGIFRLLRRRQIDSLVRTDDLVGAVGTVELPISKDSRGKVQLKIKGSTVGFVAYTDEPETLESGANILVVGTESDRLWVVAADRVDRLPGDTQTPRSP